MIFVMGGKGFVGSAFVRYCQAHGLDYAVVELDNYQDHVGRHCDILINADGNSKKYLARDKPLEEFDASVRSVRASLVDFRTDYYVHVSTCDVYPDCSAPAVTQEDQEIDIARQSPYGFHKYLAEQCVRHGAVRWLIPRFGGFVGPGMKKNPIFDILRGGPLWLDPESELQYLHTDRAAEIVFRLIDLRLDKTVVNVCGDGLVKLSDVMSLAGRRAPVSPGSPCVRYDVSINKLKQWVDVPHSWDMVSEFVKAEIGLS